VSPLPPRQASPFRSHSINDAQRDGVKVADLTLPFSSIHRRSQYCPYSPTSHAFADLLLQRSLLTQSNEFQRRITHKIAPSIGGCGIPLDAWFLGPTPVHISNDVLNLDRFIHFSTADGYIQQTRHTQTIRYDTRCYFNVRSKADMSRLNLPHGNTDHGTSVTIGRISVLCACDTA